MIIFIYGQDSYRSRLKLKELKDKFLRDVDPAGSSLVTLEGEIINLTKLNEAAGSASLFSRKRMIVIERIFNNKSKIVLDQILDFLKNKNEKKPEKNTETNGSTGENIIIFWDDAPEEKISTNKLYKYLSGQKYSQNFKLLSNTDTTAWIRKEIELRGGKIKTQAAISLTGLFGNNLWHLNNEINKLISFKRGLYANKIIADDNFIIEEKDIENLARGSFDENIFALTDAISNKNKPLAAKLFENEIEAGVTETYLLFMIIRQFKILTQVRQCLDNGDSPRKITSYLKLHPFIVQKSVNQVRVFNLSHLKKIYSQLVSMDFNVKTGQADALTMLDLLLAKI
jgi:DNA polymerase-3 subunit delta